MLPKNQNQAFQSFSKAVKQNDLLEKKTTLLIYLASAMAFGCYP